MAENLKLVNMLLFCMSVGGSAVIFNAIVYTVTDVKDLHEWMVQHFNDHPLFVQLSDDDIKDDPVIEKLYDSSEEGQKVSRNQGEKFLAVFRRVPDPYVPK